MGRTGRPSRAEAARLAARILEAARQSFFREGYASTSMEAVAVAAQVSKRTLYRYHQDKPTLLRAVIAALIEGWRPPFDAEVIEPDDLPATLARLANRILDVALTPDALALHRLALAESARFPEIGAALRQAGVASAINRIAALLVPFCGPGEATWYAEQFQRLVVSGPQDRALGLGEALGPAEREAWAQRSVRLFLSGIERSG